MSDFKDKADVASIGLEMGGCVTVGYFLGAWVDATWATAPWGLVFFLLCGFGAAVKGLLRVARRARRATLSTPDEASARALVAHGVGRRRS